MQAQQEKILTNKGNEALESGDFEAAREAYTKALEINPKYKEAQFNLGNTYQMEARKTLEQVATAVDEEQKKAVYEKAQGASKNAAAEFEKVAENLIDPSEVNKVQYNLGNAQLMSGEVDKGIDAYKEALRKDPTDEDARYNLAYAKYLKKQQEQQQQNQDQKQDQEQKQDDKNEDQKKENQEEKKNDEQKEQDQQQKDELSKQDAEKMLEALAKQEKDLQDKLNKKKVKAQPIKIEKDW